MNYLNKDIDRFDNLEFLEKIKSYLGVKDFNYLTRYIEGKYNHKKKKINYYRLNNLLAKCREKFVY